MPERATLPFKVTHSKERLPHILSFPTDAPTGGTKKRRTDSQHRQRRYDQRKKEERDKDERDKRKKRRDGKENRKPSKERKSEAVGQKRKEKKQARGSRKREDKSSRDRANREDHPNSSGDAKAVVRGLGMKRSKSNSAEAKRTDLDAEAEVDLDEEVKGLLAEAAAKQNQRLSTKRKSDVVHGGGDASVHHKESRSGKDPAARPNKNSNGAVVPYPRGREDSERARDRRRGGSKGTRKRSADRTTRRKDKKSSHDRDRSKRRKKERKASPVAPSSTAAAPAPTAPLGLAPGLYSKAAPSPPVGLAPAAPIVPAKARLPVPPAAATSAAAPTAGAVVPVARRPPAPPRRRSRHLPAPMVPLQGSQNSAIISSTPAPTVAPLTSVAPAPDFDIYGDLQLGKGPYAAFDSAGSKSSKSWKQQTKHESTRALVPDKKGPPPARGLLASCSSAAAVPTPWRHGGSGGATAVGANTEEGTQRPQQPPLRAATSLQPPPRRAVTRADAPSIPATNPPPAPTSSSKANKHLDRINENWSDEDEEDEEDFFSSKRSTPSSVAGRGATPSFAAQVPVEFSTFSTMRAITPTEFQEQNPYRGPAAAPARKANNVCSKVKAAPALLSVGARAAGSGFGGAANGAPVAAAKSSSEAVVDDDQADTEQSDVVSVQDSFYTSEEEDVVPPGRAFVTQRQRSGHQLPTTAPIIIPSPPAASLFSLAPTTVVSAHDQEAPPPILPLEEAIIAASRQPPVRCILEKSRVDIQPKFLTVKHDPLATLPCDGKLRFTYPVAKTSNPLRDVGRLEAVMVKDDSTSASSSAQEVVAEAARGLAENMLVADNDGGNGPDPTSAGAVRPRYELENKRSSSRKSRSPEHRHNREDTHRGRGRDEHRRKNSRSPPAHKNHRSGRSRGRGRADYDSRSRSGRGRSGRYDSRSRVAARNSVRQVRDLRTTEKPESVDRVTIDDQQGTTPHGLGGSNHGEFRSTQFEPERFSSQLPISDETKYLVEQDFRTQVDQRVAEANAKVLKQFYDDAMSRVGPPTCLDDEQGVLRKMPPPRKKSPSPVTSGQAGAVESIAASAVSSTTGPDTAQVFGGSASTMVLSTVNKGQVNSDVAAKCVSLFSASAREKATSAARGVVVEDPSPRVDLASTVSASPSTAAGDSTTKNVALPAISASISRTADAKPDVENLLWFMQEHAPSRDVDRQTSNWIAQTILMHSDYHMQQVLFHILRMLAKTECSLATTEQRLSQTEKLFQKMSLAFHDLQRRSLEYTMKLESLLHTREVVLDTLVYPQQLNTFANADHLLADLLGTIRRDFAWVLRVDM